MSDDRFQLQRLLEAILFASSEPLGLEALKARMPEDADIPGLLQELRDHYANRGVHLSVVEERWCFRTAGDLTAKFHIEQKVERKLTRAAVETMAIIAYHQPVTRAEIEEIRGVVISKGTLDNLLEAGWIKPKGRRQTPGRPVTWVTTEAFLEHFGLESCDALPGVEELRAAGLLDARNNSATLGVQGTLPPGGDATEEDDEADDEVDDDRSAGLADDAYEAGVLARMEGAEAEENVPPGDTEGDAALDDELTDAELPEADEAAHAEAEADLAEEMEEPDLADIETGVLPDELLDDPESYEDAAERDEEDSVGARHPGHAPDGAAASDEEVDDAEAGDDEEDEAGKAS
ncbi:MAG TPA: SMC-Scp complex subunit ScpB [Terriglobales bacterium]|nr:SMC-Scp complex subunit ScpB [Terriglobales bacterium]